MEYISNSNLTESQKKYALDLLSLPKESYHNWVSSVHDFVKEIQGSGLSVSEQYPLFAMASVALKSAEYWMEKEILWKKVLQKGYNDKIHMEGYNVLPVDFSWSKLIGIDATGALSGSGLVLTVSALSGLWAIPIGVAVTASGAYFDVNYSN